MTCPRDTIPCLPPDDTIPPESGGLTEIDLANESLEEDEFESEKRFTVTGQFAT